MAHHYVELQRLHATPLQQHPLPCPIFEFKQTQNGCLLHWVACRLVGTQGDGKHPTLPYLVASQGRRHAVQHPD